MQLVINLREICIASSDVITSRLALLVCFYILITAFSDRHALASNVKRGDGRARDLQVMHVKPFLLCVSVVNSCPRSSPHPVDLLQHIYIVNAIS